MSTAESREMGKSYSVKTDSLWNKLAAIVFTIGFAVYWFSQHGWSGSVLALVSVVYLAWLLYDSTRTEIVCDSDGFSVCSESFRTGKVVTYHHWRELVSTLYEPSDSSEESSTKAHFEASGREGRLFMMLETMPSFGEVIELFNSSTPHLPYVWKAKTGLFGSTYYVRVERAALPG